MNDGTDIDYREPWAEAPPAADQAADAREHERTFTEAGVVRFCDYHDARDEDER
tara:strand:- start:547 stop:708 length:162 start_codon:yes stop_codon:yes gene_type:complete